MSSYTETAEINLGDIINASDLKTLNHLLTGLMKQQKIQTLIRGESLGTVVKRIMELAVDGDGQKKLFTAAILGPPLREDAKMMFSHVPQNYLRLNLLQLKLLLMATRRSMPLDYWQTLRPIG